MIDTAAPAIKVGKDGTVTRDGDPIGKVERIVPDGLHVRGMSVSFSDKPLWQAYNAGGEKLGYEEATRKRAVSRVLKDAEPVRASDFKTERGLSRSGAECITGWVTWKGYSFGVSRYPSEGYWVVDFLSTPGSMMPQFSNGTGSRYTTVRTLKGEQAKAATDEAIRVGLLPEGSPAEPPAQEAE